MLDFKKTSKNATFVVRNKTEIEEEFGNDLRVYLLKQFK
jgi:hypothetical protein